VLLFARRIAGLRYAEVGARLVEGGDSLTHKTVVARHVERYKRLNAGVADILQLFVIRTVYICFNGAKPRRAPADFPNFIDGFVVGCKIAVFLEGIANRHSVKVFNHERFVLGFDFKADIAVCSEPQWREFPAVASVGTEAVGYRR